MQRMQRLGKGVEPMQARAHHLPHRVSLLGLPLLTRDLLPEPCVCRARMLRVEPANRWKQKCRPRPKE